LFLYKKKNGTKSNLVKMYMERIVKDHEDILPSLMPEAAATAAAEPPGLLHAY
jgi:hypothetical protein